MAPKESLTSRSRDPNEKTRLKKRPWLIPAPDADGRYVALPKSRHTKKRAKPPKRAVDTLGLMETLQGFQLEEKNLEKIISRYQNLRNIFETTRLDGQTAKAAMRIALKQSDYTGYLNVVNQELVVLDEASRDILSLEKNTHAALANFHSHIYQQKSDVINELFDVSTSLLALIDKTIPHKMLVNGRLHSRAQSRQRRHHAHALIERHEMCTSALRLLLIKHGFLEIEADADDSHEYADVIDALDACEKRCNAAGIVDIQDDEEEVVDEIDPKDFPTTGMLRRMEDAFSEYESRIERLKTQLTNLQQEHETHVNQSEREKKSTMRTVESMVMMIESLKSQVAMGKDDRERLLHEAYEEAYSRARGHYIEELEQYEGEVKRLKGALRAAESDLQKRIPRLVNRDMQTDPVDIPKAHDTVTEKAEKKLSAWDKYMKQGKVARPARRPGRLSGIVAKASNSVSETDNTSWEPDATSIVWAKRCISELYAYSCIFARYQGTMQNSERLDIALFFLRSEAAPSFSALLRCFFLDTCGSPRLADVLIARLVCIANKLQFKSKRFAVFLKLLDSSSFAKKHSQGFKGVDASCSAQFTLSGPKRLMNMSAFHAVIRLLRELQFGEDNNLLPNASSDGSTDMVPFSEADRALRVVLEAAGTEARDIGQCAYQMKKICDANSDKGLCTPDSPSIGVDELTEHVLDCFLTDLKKRMKRVGGFLKKEWALRGCTLSDGDLSSFVSKYAYVELNQDDACCILAKTLEESMLIGIKKYPQSMPILRSQCADMHLRALQASIEAIATAKVVADLIESHHFGSAAADRERLEDSAKLKTFAPRSRVTHSLIFLSDTWSRTRPLAEAAVKSASQVPSGADWSSTLTKRMEEFDNELKNAIESNLAKAKSRVPALKGSRSAMLERSQKCWDTFRKIMETSIRGFQRH